VVVFYGGVVAWLTWPLAAHLRTHLAITDPIARFEVPLVAWTLAWESHALVTAPLRLADANIYHPAPHALFYGPTAYGALPYFMPTFLLTGDPALSLNVMFLACLALTATALHLVVHRWTGSHLGGFVAAWTFLTTPWLLWGQGPGAEPNYAVLQYFPFIVLVTAEPLHSVGGMLGLVALVILQGAANPVYIAPAVFVPLVVVALGRLVRRSTRASAFRLLAAIIVAAIALGVLHAGHLVVRAENPHLAVQTYWTRPSSTQLMWGPLVYGPTAIARASALIVLVGAAIFTRRLLADRALARRRAWTHATLWAVIGFLISVPPIGMWGDTRIVFPHLRLAAWAGVYGLVREPSRLGVASLTGLALLAGLGFAECTRSWARRRAIASGLAAILAVTMYAEYARGFCLRLPALPCESARPLPQSYPLMTATRAAPGIYDVVRERGGPLVELPFAVPGTTDVLDVPAAHARAMYRSIFHWRPILNGYSGFWPERFPVRIALARRLPDPQVLAALRQETGLAMIVVHLADFAHPEPELEYAIGSPSRPSPFAPGAALAEREVWATIADRGGTDALRLVARDGDDLLFAVVE